MDWDSASGPSFSNVSTNPFTSAPAQNAFPAPVSDQMHDAYFVFSIMRALDQVDAMKSEVPMLGHSQALDYAAAEQAEEEAAAVPTPGINGRHRDLGGRHRSPNACKTSQ